LSRVRVSTVTLAGRKVFRDELNTNSDAGETDENEGEWTARKLIIPVMTSV
jgi:hypothetical protein